MQKLLEQFKPPLLASEHGVAVDKLTYFVHALMALLFIGWLVYFVYSVWRFRAKKNPKADYVGVTNHSSTYIEVTVAVVEGILLFLVAIPAWSTAVDKFPDPSQSTVLRITAKQFSWMARYPGADGKFGSNRVDLVSAENPLGLDKTDPASKDDVESPEIQVPVNKPVIAHITSMDVIHSFKVIALRMTQDANPGMSIPIHFVPTITNTYQIQCSQLCGNMHYSMRGIFKVVPQADFDAWLKTKAGGAGNYE